MSGVVNGNCHSIVTSNLGNGVLGSSKTPPLKHQHTNGTTDRIPLPHSSSRRPPLFQKPQISIESADELEDTLTMAVDKSAAVSSQLTTHMTHYSSRSSPNSPLAREHVTTATVSERDTSNLKVMYSSSPKSNSLPPGIAIRGTAQASVDSSTVLQYESDTSDDNHLSDDGGRDKHTHLPFRGPRKKHSETLDSTSELYLDSSSESSSEEEEEGGLHIGHDDEVFHDHDIDTYNEADSKLVDWAYNVFTPACHILLEHCVETGEDGETNLHLIQSDLRHLSNTINYFCSEQQRLSGVLKSQLKGISQSISTDRFAKLAIDKSKTLHVGSSSSTASLSSESSNLFDGHDSRSYAVKVLRSVSQSLIAPLLNEAESGFTHELHKSIVQALQKISWKVEACLSFNDPSKEFEIHTRIFDQEQVKKVREMMIGALPPEEPKIKSAVTHLSVSDSLSPSTSSSQKSTESTQEAMSSGSTNTSHIIRRTPSGKLRPSGEVFDPKRLPPELTAVTHVSSEEGNSDESPERKGRVVDDFDDSKANNYSPSRLRRTHTVAAGDSPKRIGPARVLEERQPGSPRYFRPKAQRRTTISLSRHEVSNLGLTVAKRMDESMLLASLQYHPSHEMCARAEETTEDSIHVEMEKARDQLRANLTREFERINSSPIDSTYKKKSASTSDLLDESYDKESPIRAPQRHDSYQGSSTEGGAPKCLSQPVPRKSITSQTSSDSDVHVFSPDLKKSFVPLLKQQSADSEWVYVDPNSTMDPRMQRRGTYDHLSHRDKKEAKHKLSRSEKRAAKKASKASESEKRMSTSGKFTQSLIRTAQALRRGSTSKPKRSSFGRLRIGSMDLLTEDKQEVPVEDIPRPSSSMSEPPPSPGAIDKADTMPTRKGHRGTLSRFVSKKSGKQSRSFSKGDSLSRRKKSQKSGFVNSYPDDGIPMTETIEIYSQNADKSLRVVGDEQLLVSVDIANKVPAKSQKRRSLLVSNSGQWFEIVVTTNIKQFKRKHYTILRPFKQVVSLYDSLASSHVGHVYQFPDRPDRKSMMKKQRQQVEELLRWIAGNPELRRTEVFVSFLMPDDEFGSFAESGSEVSFDLLMTFYTPDVYAGSAVPGSIHGIHMVEDPPMSPSPTHPPHKHSLQKRGTLHLVKGEKEDSSTFVIKEEGRDALIVACQDDDRYVVVAGTFEKLVEQLACEEKPDARFVWTFLLGYRHYSPTIDLLTMLLTRFHMTVPPDATEEEMAYAEKWRYVIQLRVLDILTYWIKKCWPDFYRDSTVLDKIKEFIESLKRSKDTNFQLAGTNLEKVIQEKLASSRQYTLPSPQSLSPISSTPVTPTKFTTTTMPLSLSPLIQEGTDGGGSGGRLSPSRELQGWRTATRGDCCIDMNMLSAIQLARQLTLIELDFLKAIGTHELVVYTWEPNSPENKPYRKNIDAFIARFNKVSYWVASEICSISDAKLRGALIEKFIEVAKHCKELKNLNTTISVVSGLSLAAVRRLKKSWEYVGEKPAKAYRKLLPLTDPTNNHINYRKILASVHRRDRDQCIPYFGVYMRDLTFLNDATRKTLKNGLLNFSKLRAMVLKFEELKRYQRTKYFFPPEDKTQDFCRHLWCLSESDLYEASLTVEPREPVATTTETDV